MYAQIHFLLHINVFERASYNVFQQNSNIYAPCIYIQMWRWASDISWSRLKWQYPVINEPKCCCFLFVCLFVCFFVFLFLFCLFVFFFFFFFFCCCCFGFVLFLFFFFLGGGKLDYFLFQLLSELCFPTWLFTFSKVCFKFSDQASMNYRYPHVASVRLLFFVSIHSSITEIRDAATVALSCCTRSPMTLSQSQPPIISHQTVGSPDKSTLAYRQIPTLKNYDKYTFFPRTILHWNALPAFIPLLPTLAQFSNAVCQVVHLSP